MEQPVFPRRCRRSKGSNGLERYHSAYRFIGGRNRHMEFTYCEADRGGIAGVWPDQEVRIW